MIPLAMLRQPVILCSCWTAGFHIGGLLLLTYYLPVWFQAILNASPIKSGIDILPSVVSEIVFSLVAGILGNISSNCWLYFLESLPRRTVMKLGYYTPWAITGSALVTIGSGLMSTFVPTTYSSQWIGYQILAGSGRGMVLQMVSDHRTRRLFLISVLDRNHRLPRHSPSQPSNPFFHSLKSPSAPPSSYSPNSSVPLS